MMRDIGKNIRDLRQQKHLTQEELAEQLFVTRQTVSNYENGRTRPDVDQILRLAEIFDTDANAVLYGPPVPEGRKTALIQAAAGCGLTAAIYLLYRFFLPTAQDIQSFHYDPRWTAALMYVVRPVFLLLLGWSLVQVLSLAAAVKLPERPWVRCLRRGLLAIVLCGILSSLFVCISFFIDAGNVYSVLRPFLYRNDRFFSGKSVDIGIEREEFICIIESGEKLAAHLGHSILVIFEIIPGRGIGDHIPSYRIASKTLDIVERIDRIPETLRHLVAVLVKHEAIGDNRLICHGIKHHTCYGMESEEPSASLVDTLSDEISGIYFTSVEQFLVLKRIMDLSIRHGTGVKPHVDQVKLSLHRLTRR